MDPALNKIDKTQFLNFVTLLFSVIPRRKSDEAMLLCIGHISSYYGLIFLFLGFKYLI